MDRIRYLKAQDIEFDGDQIKGRIEASSRGLAALATPGFIFLRDLRYREQVFVTYRDQVRLRRTRFPFTTSLSRTEGMRLIPELEVRSTAVEALALVYGIQGDLDTKLGFGRVDEVPQEHRLPIEMANHAANSLARWLGELHKGDEQDILERRMAFLREMDKFTLEEHGI